MAESEEDGEKEKETGVVGVDADAETEADAGADMAMGREASLAVEGWRRVGPPPSGRLAVRVISSPDLVAACTSGGLSCLSDSSKIPMGGNVIAFLGDGRSGGLALGVAVCVDERGSMSVWVAGEGGSGTLKYGLRAAECGRRSADWKRPGLGLGPRDRPCICAHVHAYGPSCCRSQRPRQGSDGRTGNETRGGDDTQRLRFTRFSLAREVCDMSHRSWLPACANGGCNDGLSTGVVSEHSSCICALSPLASLRHSKWVRTKRERGKGAVGGEEATAIVDEAKPKQGRERRGDTHLTLLRRKHLDYLTQLSLKRHRRLTCQRSEVGSLFLRSASKGMQSAKAERGDSVGLLGMGGMGGGWYTEGGPKSLTHVPFGPAGSGTVTREFAGTSQMGGRGFFYSTCDACCRSSTDGPKQAWGPGWAGLSCWGGLVGRRCTVYSCCALCT